MKTRDWFRSAALLVLLATVAGLLALMFNAVRESRHFTMVFADGSRFTLLATTMGGQPFTTEKPWHRTARRLLPRHGQGWLPDPLSSFSGGSSNALILWFTLVDTNAANVSSLPWAWLRAVADNGSGFSVSSGGGSSSSGRTTVHHISVEAFPRRQPEFDIQFLNNSGGVMGSVRLRNPVRGPFPEWTPEPLPVRRTNGPLVVTLESLTERTGTWPPYAAWTSVSPRWKLETTDPLWRGAQPSYQQWTDATGNRGGSLDYRERAWKLELPFRRPNPANYQAAEKFVLPPLPVPAPGTLQVLTNEFERLGVRIKLLYLAGAGTLTITNGTNYGMTTSVNSGVSWTSRSTPNNGWEKVETWGSSKPFFLIETSNPGPLDELRFRLIGSDGKELPLSSNGYGSDHDGLRYLQAFDVTNGISSLTFEGVVSRARLLEFIINPAEVRRASALHR